VRDAFAREVQPVTDRWLRELQEMAMDLKTGRITPRSWQDQIEAFKDLIQAAVTENLRSSTPKAQGRGRKNDD